MRKSLRFEIFARDRFTCQYCGLRPPDIVLEVDHIHPRSKGGKDEPINLITSCHICNRGKSAKIISEIAPRPDADLMFLRTLQECGEAERFLKAKRQRDAVMTEIVEALSAMWDNLISDDIPDRATWNGWINRYGPEEVEIAINTCAAKARYSDLGRGPAWRRTIECTKYVSGILKKRLADKQQLETTTAESVPKIPPGRAGVADVREREFA